MNARKVDGFSAVGSNKAPARRAGKLVATNANGYLPTDIIVKANDANELDGLDSPAFQRRVGDTCTVSSAISAIDADGNVSCVSVATARTLRRGTDTPKTTSGQNSTRDWPIDGSFVQKTGEVLLALAAEVTVTAPGACTNGGDANVDLWMGTYGVAGAVVELSQVPLGTTATIKLGIGGNHTAIAPLADIARSITARVSDSCQFEDWTFQSLRFDLVLLDA
jgi:hypothetical protein